MKPQFQHTLVTSFFLWFDNHLQKRGEAYKNKTGIFYNIANYYSDDGKYWGRNDPNWKPNKPKTAGPKGYKRPTAKQKVVKGK